MRILIAITVTTVAAISLATPAQADACSDYRLSLAARDAAHDLVNERAAAGFIGGKHEEETLRQLFDEAGNRLSEAQRAVRAVLNDETAAKAIDSLLALNAVNEKAWDAMADWVGTPDGALKQPMSQLFNITVSINDAREWAFNEICH